jgi:HEPN domain-containing protein
MSRTRGWVVSAVLGVALLAMGCGGAQRDATQAAINAAQSAIDAAKEEAQRYAPDQLQAAQNTLQSAKDALNKGDYQAALSAAQQAAGKAKDMAVAAASKKSEWMQTWESLNHSLPKSMDQVKGRLDAYSKGARMPAGMDKQKLEEAKEQYAQLKQTWSDATAAAAKGNLGDAVEKATGINELLAKLKEMLGIKS